MTEWRALRVASDGTHHLGPSGPAYSARFDQVLSFHAPGLAPVRLGRDAWHVRPDGSEAYAPRFRETFGFYEGLAAVVAEDGWFHVGADGRPAYAERFDWCGNVQEGRVPVRRAGTFHHIDMDGRPIGQRTWRYAGDFRVGVAVVQREDGLHGHVRTDGKPLHDWWFVDLDVFHKGLARARDPRGWTHVDLHGRPVYERRFAMVEPFYNGRARVERFDGALEVIGADGTTDLLLRAPQVSPLHGLSADLVGYWRTSTLAAAVRYGLVERLPGATAELAGDVGEDATRRLLRALWELGVVEPRDGIWHTTERRALLARSHPRTLADAALEYGGPLAWAALDDSLAGRGRRNLFEQVAADPERRTSHHRMLASYASEDYPGLISLLPIEAGSVVLDAGGGTGTLARLVARPDVEVVLLDLPEVVADTDGPFRKIGGDLFAPWPIQADTVLLARVLHDWDDPKAVGILRRARSALRPCGWLAVLEMVLDDGHPAGALCDLHLLAVTGGRERTETEWRSLLASGGFALAEVRCGPGFVRVLIARPE